MASRKTEASQILSHSVFCILLTDKRMPFACLRHSLRTKPKPTVPPSSTRLPASLPAFTLPHCRGGCCLSSRLDSLHSGEKISTKLLDSLNHLMTLTFLLDRLSSSLRVSEGLCGSTVHALPSFTSVTLSHTVHTNSHGT